MKSSNRPNRGRHRARSRLDDSEQLLDRKRRQAKLRAGDGTAHGLVEILGPLPAPLLEEVKNIARKMLERERRRDAAAALVSIAPIEDGLAIETSSEKLAQHIADALARSRKATVERAYDDEGKRRILTCRLPTSTK